MIAKDQTEQLQKLLVFERSNTIKYKVIYKYSNRYNLEETFQGIDLLERMMFQLDIESKPTSIVISSDFKQIWYVFTTRDGNNHLHVAVN